MTKIATVQDILDHGLSRRDAMRVACPKCGATPAAHCIGRRSPPQQRISPHIERYDHAANAVEVRR